MKVLMLCEHDDSNSGWETAHALGAVGINVIFQKQNRHRFEYPHQGDPIENNWQRHLDTCDVLWLCKAASTWSLRIAEEAMRSDKRLVVQYGGTKYRQNPQKWDNLYKRWEPTIIVQTGDLMTNPQAHLFISPVDTDSLLPIEKGTDTLRIGHFPSHPAYKGTEAVLRVLYKLKKHHFFEVAFDPAPVPWNVNLLRMAQCHIIVETLCPEQDGKPLGEFGVTSREACALGCVVVTNNIHPHYTATYGKTYFETANSERDLEAQLTNLIFVGTQVGKIAREKRAVLVQNHSYRASGERLLKLLA